MAFDFQSLLIYNNDNIQLTGLPNTAQISSKE